MEILVLTDGPESLIAVRRDPFNTDTQIVESSLIFQNPNFLKERLISIMKCRFPQIDFDKVVSIVFGINGQIDPKTNAIVESKDLNKLSITDSYNGFSFKDYFEDLVDIKKILTVDNTLATAYRVRKEFTNIPRPLLILTDNSQGTVGVILQGDQVECINTGDTLVPTLNDKPICKLIGHTGVESLAFSKTIDLVRDYSIRIGRTIEALHHRIEPDLVMKSSNKDHRAKCNVIIATRYHYLINESIIKSTYEFANTILLNEERKKWVPILGCLEYPVNTKSGNRRILRADYFANKEKLLIVNNYFELVDHWKSVKPFASDSNYYDFHYEAGGRLIVPMRELKSEADLEKYKTNFA